MIPSARVRLHARSKKRQRDMIARRILVAAILEERPACEIRFNTDCTHRATCLHERRKRSQGGSILDEANVMAACANCNSAVEDEPNEAWARGFVTRRGDA